MKKENRTANFYDVIRERLRFAFMNLQLRTMMKKLKSCLKRLFLHQVEQI
ncbi:hypothetical protein QF028_004152 [Neobacillus sp. B4I6]